MKQPKFTSENLTNLLKVTQSGWQGQDISLGLSASSACALSLSWVTLGTYDLTQETGVFAAICSMNEHCDVIDSSLFGSRKALEKQHYNLRLET
jgi:hypothetical protein